MFCSSRWVAQLCRNVCGATQLGSPASLAAMWQTRLGCRVVIGLMRSRPGNIHTFGCAMRHPSRSSSNSCGARIASRSLRASHLYTRCVQMRLDRAQTLRRRGAGGTVVERRESLVRTDVLALRIGHEPAHGHVFEHALAQRADGLLAHWEFLS